MRTLIVGGFGMALARALLREVAMPVVECDAVSGVDFDYEADYEPGSKFSRPCAGLCRPVPARLQPYRTVKDSVWTAGVAHSPRRPFELKGVTPA